MCSSDLINVAGVSRQRADLDCDVGALRQRQQHVEVAEGFFVFLAALQGKVAERQLQLGVAFGDAVDPGALEAVGLEVFLFDFGGELSLLAMGHWHLLELVLAGVVLAGGIAVLRVAFAPWSRSPSPAPVRAVEKVPIRF